MLVARENGEFVGSLSGGCIEEDFIEKIKQKRFQNPLQRLSYGTGSSNSHVQLPCGGQIQLLVERMAPESGAGRHLEELYSSLQVHRSIQRRIRLPNGQCRLVEDGGIGAAVEESADEIRVRCGPAGQLIIAGASSVAEACAHFAVSLNYGVVVCDPRPDVLAQFNFEHCQVRSELPACYIATTGACHNATAIVSLTHDARIDDLTLMEAVRTEAFYIGVMGSKRTSEQRARRLERSGQLSAEQIRSIHMPIGLDIGSRTPAEIALAVMADVVRVRRARPRHTL